MPFVSDEDDENGTDENTEDGVTDDDCCVAARMMVGCLSSVCGRVLVLVTIAIGADDNASDDDVSIELTAMATSASDPEKSVFTSAFG